MIVDNSFSRLTTRMIVHGSFSFSVSYFGNHWPDSGQKTYCRPLSSPKIHTFTSLSYGTPFSIIQQVEEEGASNRLNLFTNNLHELHTC